MQVALEAVGVAYQLESSMLAINLHGSKDARDGSPVTNLKGLVTSSSPFSLSDMFAGVVGAGSSVGLRQWLVGEGRDEVKSAMV